MTCRHAAPRHLTNVLDFSFGRKPTVLLAHLMYLLGGLGTILLQDYHFLLCMRFLVGCAHHTVSHLPFLIGESTIIGNISLKEFKLYKSFGQLMLQCKY